MPIVDKMKKGQPYDVINLAKMTGWPTSVVQGELENAILRYEVVKFKAFGRKQWFYQKNQF